MPQVRKLNADEVYALENKGKGQRKITEELYDNILADYTAGEYGEAALDENDNRLTVRNRLKAAAKRRGVEVEFRRTQGDLLRFRVVERGSGAGAGGNTDSGSGAVSSDAPPKRSKGGRPRKSP